MQIEMETSMSINEYLIQIINDDDDIDQSFIYETIDINLGSYRDSSSSDITIKSLIQISHYIANKKDQWTEDVLLEILYHDDDLRDAINKDHLKYDDDDDDGVCHDLERGDLL